MLSEIRQLLEKHSSISLYDLALHFNMDASAMEKMLDVWIKKGKIVRRDFNCSKGSCKGCLDASCDPSKMVVYERRDS